MNPVAHLQIGSPFSVMLKAGFLFALWGYVFLPVYPQLWHTWISNSNNSHCMLVPFISVFIIWRKREELAEVKPEHSAWGGVILAASLFIYLLALAGHMAVAQRAMIVCSLIGLVLFNFGKAVFRILAFPLLYLFFIVPLPVSIYVLLAFPLQLFATDIAYLFIQGLGIPVFQEGNMLYFAQTQLEVAEACSGLRSFMAFFMLAILFSYLMRSNWFCRSMLVLSALPLAMAANIARVSGTGILAHYYGEQVARGFLHDFSGMAVFIFGLLLMFAEYTLLDKAFRK